MIRRKPRIDCNYIIYSAVDQDGNCYIGLTRKTESTPLRSMKRRWVKHLSRSKQEDLDWALYRHMRLNENLKWKHSIIEIVRGRSAAYSRERELILETTPNLNTQYCR